MKFLNIAVLAGVLLGTLPIAAQNLDYRDFKLTNEMTARLKDTEVID